MQERFRRWMIGRYGPDLLTTDLVRASLVILVAGLLLRVPWTAPGAFLLTGYAWFRMFSRNSAARLQELRSYLPFRQKVTTPFYRLKGRVQRSRTHRVYKCTQCGTSLQVPKGKGKMRITCPKCGNRFEKKT